VGQEDGVAREEGRPAFADAPAGGDVFSGDGAGFFFQSSGEAVAADGGDAGHALQGPEQVDGGGAGGGKAPAGGFQAAGPKAIFGAGSEGESKRRGATDGGGAADRHVPNRPGHVRVGAAGDPADARGQIPLFQNVKTISAPAEGSDAHAAGRI
jgi:hypothetical protein